MTESYTTRPTSALPYQGSQSFYKKLAKPLLTLAAAAALYLGGGKIYAQDAQPPAAQEQKQEQKAPRQKLTQEIELEHIASQSYLEGKKLYEANKQAESVPHFLKARKFYHAAENVETKDDLFAEERTSIDEWVAVAKYNRMVKDLTPEQRSELAQVIGDYDKGVVAPKPAQQPVPNPVPQQPTADLATPQPAPQQNPPQQPVQDPAPQPADLAKAAQEPAAQKSRTQNVPVWCPQCVDIQSDGPLGADLFSLRGEVGPNARELGAYGRWGGLEAYAEFSRNAFKTLAQDDFSTKHYGGYVALDGERLLDVPFFADASFSKVEEALGSSSSSVTDDANFRVSQTTDTDQRTSRTRFSLGAKMSFEPYQVEARFYTLKENIGVDALTNLSVINKNDPSGNYTDVIRNSQSFTNTTTGGQFGFSAFLSPEVSGGLQFTLETQDLPDFKRSIDHYRGNVWLHYLSKDHKKGLHMIVGQGLMDDSGEKLTRGEYGISGVAELSKMLLASARFSHHEQPRGMLTFLVGQHYREDPDTHKLVSALPYLAEHDIRNLQMELNLDKRMDQAMLQSYIDIHHADLLRYFAESQQWQFIPSFGVSRVEQLGKEHTAYNWDVTLLAPLFKDVTLGARGYGEEDGMSKRRGIEAMVFPIGKNWRIAIRGEEETLPGQGEKDKRGLVIFDVWNK